MEDINEVNRVQLKIVLPHPGPTEDNSQLSEIISYSCTEVSDKFTLSETLSHSPDKKSKQQYLFKQGSLGLQQQKSKKINASGQRIFNQKSQSFMITQEDEKLSQQDTPNLRIKSQSNIHDNNCIKGDIQEKFQSLIIEGKQQKLKNQPYYSQIQPDQKTQPPNLFQQNSFNNQSINFTNINNNNHHHHRQASSLSTFSFQQLLPSQTAVFKNESQISQSPPAKYGINDEFVSDIIKLQDEQDNLYVVPHPTYKVSSEDNTANKNLRDQFTTFNKGNVVVSQNSKFQLSIFQTEHLISHSDDQIGNTENNFTNNNNKSINELNDDEISKSYANQHNGTNQHTSEIPQTTMNFVTDYETKELCNSNRKRRQKNISRIQLTNEDLVEMDQEDDEGGEEEEE
ncbi:hypothetical protein ABPG72_005804 [Tetrahymena utriculariae]